ncbi:hypothetical protein [Streptomyces sp. NBC_00878]|uniref:hypothetical protein n=1 Tax=Streptomyces sp. NBC_00878 TaxID=2975854 RepID=UPI002253A936|nr:hypothetical protein [Streptomyces sp. NBC_00878]MCX4907387.1 hypothetical protein [Streptomyces sp. NBC_00878]
MSEDEDEAAGAAEEAPAASGPAGPFLKDYNTLTDGLPRVSPRSALVQFYRNGGYSVIKASGVQHVEKRALARPHSICEIALGTYVTPLQMELPAAGGTTFFKAEVDIEWRVTDPHLAALEVVTDVANRLTSPVLERLCEVTTTYRVNEAEAANRAITRECVGGRWADLGSELGLRVRLYVRLRVDDRTIEHADEERDAHAQAKVTRLRQESFRRMLQGGELEQLSFMLAADPEGAKDFLEKIRQEGRQDEKDRVARLFAMASRGELATVDVETQVLNLLNQGVGRPMVGPIGTVPARREPRQLEPSADRPFNPDWASDEPPRRRPHRAEPSRGEPDRQEAGSQGASRRGSDGRGSDGRGSDGRGIDGRGSDGRGIDRQESDRRGPYPGDDAGYDSEYDAGYDAGYDEPRSRARRQAYRPEPHRPESQRSESQRSESQRSESQRSESHRSDRYQPEPYRADAPRPGDDAAYDGPRSRDRQQARRPESDYGYDEPRSRDRRPPQRPELYSGADSEDDRPRSRTRRETYRPEPYEPRDDRREDRRDDPRDGAAYDGSRAPARRDTYQPEPRRPEAYQPEPYYPDDRLGQAEEPPRRRRRSEDDGWSWTEEEDR